MKGPRQKIDYDVRRIWECPICRRRRKTCGSAVAERCSCQKEGSWMRLVEERRLPRTWPHHQPQTDESDTASSAIDEASSAADDTSGPQSADAKQEQNDQATTNVAAAADEGVTDEVAADQGAADEGAVEASEGDPGNDSADEELA